MLHNHSKMNSFIVDFGVAQINEVQWVGQMKGILVEKQPNDIYIPVCIMQVPPSIHSSLPEAYTPQLVALGPIHHFRPRLYQMQSWKLGTVQSVCGLLNLGQPSHLIDEMTNRAYKIRGSYNEPPCLGDEALSWVMVIDGLFFVKLMFCDDIAASGVTTIIDSSSGRKYPLRAMLEDIFMLENQIPTIAIEALLWRFLRSGADILISEQIHICSQVSPIELKGKDPCPEMVQSKSLHLLDCLHQLIWLGKTEKIQLKGAFFARTKIWTDLRSMLSTLNFGFIAVVLNSADLILYILDTFGISIRTESDLEDNALVPSAAQLGNAGVKFCPIKIGGIRDISFKQETKKKNKKAAAAITLNLPVLSSKGISEVVMRNLLAYEALIKLETPNFTRYVEFMCALTCSAADVEFLKREKIIPQQLDSAEIVGLFSRLSQSTSTTTGLKGKKTKLDETFSQINQYYNSTRKVKAYKLMKRYLFMSWKVLTALALILLLLLMALQTFCSMGTCPRIFKQK